MSYAIVILLAALSLLAVAHPLLRGRFRAREPEPPEALDTLARERRAIFEDVDRLNLDLDVGTLTGDEYRRQLAALRRAAAENLRAQESLDPGAAAAPPPTPDDADQALEERINRLREDLKPRDPGGP